MTILYILLSIFCSAGLGIYFGEKLAKKEDLTDDFKSRKLDGDFSYKKDDNPMYNEGDDE